MPLIEWNPNLVAVQAFGLTIHWYGALFAMAFLIGSWILGHFFKRERIPKKHLDPLLITMVLSTVVGARLGHCLFYAPEYYLANPMDILKVWEGGLASHGATIGILLGLWIFSIKVKATPFLWLIDRLVVTIALGGAMIRFGNFINGEILGKPTSGDWGVIFLRIDAIPRHPAQLYESLTYLALFGLLWLLYHKSEASRIPGRMGGIFLTITFGSRILIEMVKENQEAFEEGMLLNMGQLLSVPFILLGLFLILYGNKQRSLAP